MPLPRSFVGLLIPFVVFACSKAKEEKSAIYIAGDSPEHLRESCEGGIAPACLDLARRHSAGDGVEKDASKMASFSERACDLGDMKICSALAELYLEGKAGVVKDAGKAVTLYNRACSGGWTNACVALGGAYIFGKTGAVDEDKALELFARACERDDRNGCHNAGTLVGKRGDREGRDRFFKRACTLGDKTAC